MGRVNWPVALIGVAFWYLETSYFGWNTHPGSVAELFADGLALAIIALAFVRPRQTVINVKMGGDDGRGE